MLPDRTGLRRAPIPLLPSVLWVVLSSLRIGKVAVLLVLVLAFGLVEMVRFAVATGGQWPAAYRPAVAATGLAGVALGSELGFAFGGGRGLGLWAVTAWLAARAAAVAALIAFSSAARARPLLYRWRRCQVASVVLSVVLWLVLLASTEVKDPAVSAVSVHGVRLDMPGGVGLLLLLVAVSLLGEGALQLQAHRATGLWLTSRPSPRRAAPSSALGAPFVDDEPPMGPPGPSPSSLDT